MSAIIPEKCEECEGEYALLPCPFCGRAVTTRFNAMTGKHYISHVELNNTCPQPPFYGEAALWNDRLTENRLRAELDACRIIHKSAEIATLKAECPHSDLRMDTAGLRCMICGKQFVTTQTTITWSGT